MSPIPLGFWATAGAGAAGGAAAYELIETAIVPAGSGYFSVYFGSIPQDYKHLQMRVASRSTYGASNDKFYIMANLSQYDRVHYLRGSGASVTSTYSTNADFGISPADSAASGIFGAAVIDFLDYTSTTKNRVIRSLNGTTSPTEIRLSSGLLQATGAITNVSFGYVNGNVAASSRISLYGIKG